MNIKRGGGVTYPSPTHLTHPSPTLVPAPNSVRSCPQASALPHREVQPLEDEALSRQAAVGLAMAAGAVLLRQSLEGAETLRRRDVLGREAIGRLQTLRQISSAYRLRQLLETECINRWKLQAEQGREWRRLQTWGSCGTQEILHQERWARDCIDQRTGTPPPPSYLSLGLTEL